MKQVHFLIIIAGIFLFAGVCLSAEPDKDQFIGKVNLGSKFKPDAKGRKAIAAIASKIMKIKQVGSIRVRGDFPGAENPDDYLLQSVFMAREIEQQLKPLLKNRFQVYVMASKYSGEKSAVSNSVDIFFYPRELNVGDTESLRYKSVQQKELPKEIEIPEGQVQDAIQKGYEATDQPQERGVADTRTRDSKKMKPRLETEDPVKADALVNRVKARAAERARREALESAPVK